ncbi:Tetratricopeptide repeat-containing protein [Pseudoxanthomonas indica]|uniref:Tetratricopeptide repeat-containing protein n=2 Tax=Pseudoxanthomonas indica TaxID=428993 RepID=A0A1T5JMF7_9GAMM|nr:membrane protein [Pseudoxanthomonas indica]SKC52575.1 Tetratricopeptide repeat-containing protein [Pseudoxanthomonas indica]
MMRISLAIPLLLVLALPAQAARKPAPVREEPLGAVMAGEFALQSGQLSEASRWYLQAARASEDAGLAERATRIALLSNDDAGAAEALKLWRARAPKSLAMRSAEATLAIRRNNARAARRELSALMADPDEMGWRYALTALGSGGRDPDLSAKLLGELVDDGAIPAQLQAWLAFAGLAQQLDQPDLSQRIVGLVVTRFPQEPRVALLHASQLRRSGDEAGAREVLDGLHEAAANTPELRLATAAEYEALGDSQAAAGMLAEGPQDDQTYALRASLLAKADDDRALTALYDELRKEDADPEPERRLLLGQMAEFLKRPQQALDWYRSVASGNARSEARLRSANTLFELDRQAEALAELKSLQGDAAADDEARINAYLLEAELRRKAGNDAAELEVFARGLAAYPDDVEILYSRGLAWERRDRIDRAEADFRKILVIDPENTATLNALGYTLADRTQRFQEALQLIDRARTADPENAAIIDSYGWVLYRIGRLPEALIELRRAYALQKDPEIAAHVGEVLWVMGQKDEARRYFEEARKLDPENRSLQRALEKTGA